MGTVTEKESKLYFEARDRALEREVMSRIAKEQCITGFSDGFFCASPALSDVKNGPEIIKGCVARIKSESNYGIGFIAGVLCYIEGVKGKAYAASWQKKGEAGVMANVQRKYDRLDAIMENRLSNGDSQEDTLGDLAVYSMKWLTLRQELDSERFMKWLEDIRNI